MLWWAWSVCLQWLLAEDQLKFHAYINTGPSHSRNFHQITFWLGGKKSAHDWRNHETLSRLISWPCTLMTMYLLSFDYQLTVYISDSNFFSRMGHRTLNLNLLLVCLSPTITLSIASSNSICNRYGRISRFLASFAAIWKAFDHVVWVSWEEDWDWVSFFAGLVDDPVDVWNVPVVGPGYCYMIIILLSGAMLTISWTCCQDWRHRLLSSEQPAWISF